MYYLIFHVKWLGNKHQKDSPGNLYLNKWPRNINFLFSVKFLFMPLFYALVMCLLFTTVIIGVTIIKISFHIYNFILFHLGPLQIFTCVSHSIRQRIFKVGFAFLEMVLCNSVHRCLRCFQVTTLFILSERLILFC